MSKLHSITIQAALYTDEGDERGLIKREYRIADVSTLEEIFGHAGRSAALFFEGVEKLNMEDPDA